VVIVVVQIVVVVAAPVVSVKSVRCIQPSALAVVTRLRYLSSLVMIALFTAATVSKLRA
jgi:hypothetical protein